MFTKIAVLVFVVAVANGAPGALIAPGAVTYAAAPAVYAAPVAAAPLGYHHHAAPVVYSAPAVVNAAPVAYTSTVVRPIEHHGYQIVY